MNNKQINCLYNDAQKRMCFITTCEGFKPKYKGWTVYGLERCPYNKKAQKLLMDNGHSYYYFDIEEAPFYGKENFKKMMGDLLNGQQTTPAIYKNGFLLGGSSDLDYFLQKNKK